MKSLITFNRFPALLIGLSLVLFILNACSASESTGNQKMDSSVKTFIFRDGNDVYRVEFNGKQITSLFKNERKIPDDEIDNYKDLIVYELKHLTRDFVAEKEKPTRIKIFIDKDKSENDTTKFDEEDNIDIPMLFKFKMDDKDFEVKLDSLLKDLDDKHFEIYINPDDIREPMMKFKKHFRDFTPPQTPDIDLEKFYKEMQKFREQMKFNSPEYDSLFYKFREKMKEFKKRKNKNIEIIELNNNDEEIEDSESFINEIKKELVKDGYLDSVESPIHFMMNEDKISVNNKDLSEELLDKYKEIFRKHHGRNLNGQILIELD
jgi:hypothetical protein